MWEEEGGGAGFHLSALNPIRGTNNVLNDPADPVGVTKVYFLGVPTGPSVFGDRWRSVFGSRRGCDQHGDQDRDRADVRQYAVLPDECFHRLTIKSITVVGANVAITYQ